MKSIRDAAVEVEKQTCFVIGPENDAVLKILKSSSPGSYLLSMSKFFFNPNDPFYTLSFLDSKNELIKCYFKTAKKITGDQEQYGYIYQKQTDNKFGPKTFIDNLDELIKKFFSDYEIKSAPSTVKIEKTAFIKPEEKTEFLIPEKLSKRDIELKKEAVTALVHQDASIQWSPKKGVNDEGTLYILTKHEIPTVMENIVVEEYKPVAIKDKKMILKSNEIQDCTTIIIHDTEKNNWLVTHVSPQSLRKAQGKSVISVNDFFAFDAALDAHAKIIIKDLKSSSYTNKAIGI